MGGTLEGRNAFSRVEKPTIHRQRITDATHRTNPYPRRVPRGVRPPHHTRPKTHPAITQRRILDRPTSRHTQQPHGTVLYLYPDDDYDAFDNVDEYVYSRFKRCVYHRVTHILDAHADEYQAFQFVLDTVEERKIRRIGWRRLRNHLFDDDTPYIEWRVLESVVEQLNQYYDRHGRFPDQYTELVEPPEPNGTLPYAPDKGDYHIHELTVEDGDIVVTLNAPDSLSPDSYHDWTDHEIRFPTYSRFHEMIEAGEMKAPTLHSSNHGYTLDVPVDLPEQNTDTVENRILAVDLGVKKTGYRGSPRRW